MDRVKLLKSAFFMVFVVFASKKCHSFLVPAVPRSLPPPPTPLCISQFALVNHACARVNVQPLSLNSPQESLVETSPTPPSPPDETIHGHGYRRRHEGQEDEDEDSNGEEECCRWLNVVDVECVCPLLIRLPNVFLRLAHNYTVVVSESCRVTYQCEELQGL